MLEFITHYWLQVFFGVIVSILSYTIKSITKKVTLYTSQQDSLKMGVQAMLRDRIIATYNESEKLGYCPIYARENLQELTTQYFNLGGNGVVHDLVDKISKLPTEPPQKGSEFKCSNE